MPFLKILKSPQYILIGIVIAALGYFYYDYTSIKNTNQQLSNTLSEQASELRSLRIQYVGVASTLKRQERAVEAYIEAIEEVRQDSAELRTYLQEINDEKLRESLDTVIDSDILDRLLKYPFRTSD